MTGDEVIERLAAIDTQQNDIKRKLYAQEAMQRLAMAHKWPRCYPEFRSQYGEDMLAWSMLDYAIGGTYVEVGGFDGETFSVTYALDAIGWEGVLIEAIPDMHAASLRNRPCATSMHSAVGPRGCDAHTMFVVVQGDGMFSGAEGSHEITPNLPAATKPRKRLDVPYSDMDDLLYRRWPRGTQLDLAVIDVEGAELDVLDGMDFDVWMPRVVLIEDNSFGCDHGMDRYFAKDYQLLGHLACNRVYGRKDDPQVCRFMNPTS